MNSEKFKLLRGKVQHYLKKARAKFHRVHIKRTTIALILTLPYLLLEWSARAFNLYLYFRPVDTILHILFGVAFASIALLIYEKKPQFILLWAFALAILWEGLEKLGDVILSQPSYLLDIFFYDGMKDISVTFLGAVVTVFVIRKFIKRHYFKIV